MLYSVPCYAETSVSVITTDTNLDLINDKTGVNVFQNTINKLNQLKDINWRESAPVFKLNLHSFNDSMEDKEIVFCDFKKLETIQFLGMSIIDYFRMIISAILYFETGMYVYRNLRQVIPT
jgi:hypothetical protein